MIVKTWKKELKEMLREGRVRVSLIIVIALMIVAVFISKKQYENVNSQYELARTTERALWDDQGEKNPHSAAHYGTYAFKPKYPLSLVDQGVDKYAGTSIFLEAHNRNEAQFSAAADQTGLARFGDLTPDFILLFIIPLLIILLGYNCFTKEREMGTLTLLKSQGVNNLQWMIGKWVALFLPILLITLALFLTAGILLSGLEDFGQFSWSSLWVMLGIYLIYYTIFTNLVLIISARAKRSGISLVLSLGLWIVACLAAPKAASNIAEERYPYPTRQDFAANVMEDKKKGLDGHNPWSKEAKLLEEQVLAEYGVDSLHKLPFNFDGYRMQKGEEHEAMVYAKHYNHLKEQYNGQAGVYKTLAVISPYLPTRFMSMAVAHTDYGTHWDFSDAAEDYRVATQKFLNENFAENSAYGEWGYRADVEFWSELPPFQYEPESLSNTLERNALNLVIMGLWFAFSFGLLIVITKRV